MTTLGLFIGAGASYEAGMPLVWELTDQLRQWLTIEKLTSLNESWKRAGAGYEDSVVNDLAELLKANELHYENILGELQNKFVNGRNQDSGHYSLYSWLIERVHDILYLRHTKNVNQISQLLRFFRGIESLAARAKPLWVFSLNHDMIIECLGAQNKIPINAGFDASSIVSLTRRDSQGLKIGELKAEAIPGIALEKSRLSFFENGNFGINLIKIHGALDIFTYNDGQDLLRILPVDDSVTGIIESLRATNEELLYFDPGMLENPVKTLNEITYADEQGEMQFLRRTLLSGAYKFDSRVSQVLPQKMLDLFKINIENVTHLVCAGYSFGDKHINDVMCAWLKGSDERTIEIVSPHIEHIPPPLIGFSPQVKITKDSFTNYLDNAAGIERSRREVLEKKLASWCRKAPDSTVKEAEFKQFVSLYMKSQVESLIRNASNMLAPNEKIDLPSQQELITKVLSESKQDGNRVLTIMASHEY